jgi:SAM-dependent methyltransferase
VNYQVPALPESFNSYYGRARAFYSRLAKVYLPDDVRRVGWTSEESQTARFNVLWQYGGLNTCDDILDVGCGVGDLLDYLQVRRPRGGYTYVGLDLLEENVAVMRMRFPGVDARVGHPWDVSRTFTTVVGSGIFALPAPDWEDLVGMSLRRLFDLCRRRVVVNFLHVANGPTTETARRVNPGDVDRVAQAMSADVTIIDGYAEGNNDFTVCLSRSAWPEVT